jgi:hypothetical protein
MSSWKRALGGVAAFGLVALLNAQASSAASLAARDGVGRAPAGQLERVVFHGHSTRGISYYCYPRNYWWFYRPYTTANDGYARCMPYVHYPPQSYLGGGDGEMK